MANTPPVDQPQPPVSPSRRSPIWLIITIIIITALLIVGFFLKRPTKPLKPADGSNELPSGPVSSRRDANGPYSHQIYSATSTDSLTWTTNDTLLFDHASVPGAARFNDKVYLYFVDASNEQDQLSVAISTDDGLTFGDPQQVKIEGVQPYDAVDPSPEVVDGQLYLYYLGDFMSNKEPSQKFKFYSAVSTDGVNFTDPVLAYSFDEMTTDPDVYPVDAGWQMFASQGRDMVLLTSTDGRSFTPVDDFSWSLGAVSDTAIINGTYRTFYCGEGIQSATGANTGTLKAESGVRVLAPEKITCDPSLITQADGSYRLFYKTQAAPSMAQPGPGNQPSPQTQP